MVADLNTDFHRDNKNWLGGWLVGRALMLPALRRAFRGVYAWVDPQTRRLSRRADVPIIFCATHSGWWDGHMAYILDRAVFHKDPYVMMEERQLARYAFFTWVGAFGIVKERPRAALASLQYASELLLRPDAALWMFPQGSMSHQDARPLRVFGGATNIAGRLERCALVPVALRYDFLREQAPSAFARVGAPTIITQTARPTSRELTSSLSEAMTAVADKLQEDTYSNSLDAYRCILTGRGSVNANWDRVRGLAGGLLPGMRRWL